MSHRIVFCGTELYFLLVLKKKEGGDSIAMFLIRKVTWTHCVIPA